MRRLLLCFLLSVFLLTACGTSEALPSEILNSTDSFAVTTELIGDVAGFDNFQVLQGGCVTEDYAWFALLDRTTTESYASTESCIVKYDMKTMEQIKCSEVLKLGHANDITYIEENNEIYVIHVNDKKVSVIDADSLEIKEEKNLAIEGHGIDYDPNNERFVTACGRASMVFWDKELKKTAFKSSQGTTLVTQGICADDTYIYHVLWSDPSNEKEPESMIFVNDWEGNLITKVPLGLKEYEPENISLVGDTFYISCNNLDDGHSIFKVKIVKVES